MRFFKMILFILLFYLFFNINCYASTKTYERTNDNLRVNDRVEVNSSNIGDIFNTPSINEKEKIYDFADLLSDSEEKKLYNDIVKYIEKTKYDAVILTVDNLSGYSISDYAYNFYDYNNFKKYGVIFVINSSNNDVEIFMGNSGEVGSKIFRLYNDEMINSTLKYLYENSFSKDNYYEGCSNFIKIIMGFYEKNNNGNYRVSENGNLEKHIPIIEIIIIAFTLTFIIMFILCNKFKSKKNALNISLRNKVNANTLMIKLDSDKII